MSPELDPKEFRDIPDPFATHGNAELRVPELVDLPESPTRAGVRSLRTLALGLALACEAGLLAIMGLRDRTTLSAPVLIYGVLLPLGSAALTLLVVQRGATRTVRVAQFAFASTMIFFVTTLLANAPGDESATNAPVSSGVGGKPVRSNDSRRRRTWRGASD